MTTYRDGIRRLERLATPPPWACDGELYGWCDNGAFMPLGFAPHRPLDGRLIAVYRSAVMRLVEAVDAVELFALRASTDSTVPAAIGIRQILEILDDGGGAATFRETVAELDRSTTPPPWDPGHLTLGMENDAVARSSLGIATPSAGDVEFIAEARSAVPRALGMLARAEGTVAEYGNRDGTLRQAGAVAIAVAVAAFDRHTIGDGIGTGTV
jgi:hypothetical protein